MKFGKYPTRNSEAKKRRQAIAKRLAYKKYLKTKLQEAQNK
jgi:hypothetical protein